MPWDPIEVDSQIVAIHAALLPTSAGGDILLFGDWLNLGADSATNPLPPFTDWRIFRVDAGTVELPAGAVTPDRDLFCSGHAFLADGRLVVGGGNLLNSEVPSADRIHGEGNMFGGGERACWLFHPRKGTWVEGGELNLAPNGAKDSGGRWYPVLVTLANGKIFAAGGHPDLRESYLYRSSSDETADLWNDTDPSSARRNNNLPELYSPATGKWKYFPDPENPTAQKTAPNYLSVDSYPRFRVMPSGRLLCDTAGPSQNNNVSDGLRFYDTSTGIWKVPRVNSTVLPFNRGSWTTSVLLPLLPPSYRPRVLACNAATATAHYLDVDENAVGTITWQTTAPRDGTSTERFDGCAVLLPTGQVFLTGGSRNIPDADAEEAILTSELYTPNIDWSAGTFTNYNEANHPDHPHDGTWVTLTSASEQQAVGRGYHSVALLLPDGRVWTAGTTEGPPDIDLASRELRMEAFRPWYMSGSRPGIQSIQPVVGYGEQFRVAMVSKQAIARVAFTRCGSVTHSFDFDQRYVGATFQQNGSRLTVTAPPNSAIAPPGNYMLWAINNAGRPCTQAKFIRLTHLDVYFALELSTYSLNAVRALKQPYTDADEAVFSGAIQLFYQSFLPHELGIPNQVPAMTWRFADGGDQVPGMRLEPSSGNPGWQVDPVVYPDVGQKFTFVYDVVFETEAAFDTFADDASRKVIVTAELGDYVVDVDLTLMKKANPYMKDGDPPWLSTDLRVFTDSVSAVNEAGSPQLYMQNVLDALNDAPEGDAHPFRLISTSQTDNPVVLEVPSGGEGVYNFAVARVSFLSIPNDDAQGVKVFFRMFSTVGTALEYNAQGTYKVLGDGATAVPGLGKQGLGITSIPFFGEPRVTPSQSMDKQTDNALNRRTLFGKGPDIDVAYFGCWLDINVLDRHFPFFPTNDGPFFQPLPFVGGPEPMLDHIRGYHQCLVAEIYYGDDPTDPGDTPFTSDNLAQRNLATVPAANPGLEITRTVQTTFEVEPSEAPTEILTAPPPPASAATGTAVLARTRPDELIFRRNDLPEGVIVTLYMPDVSIDEVLAIAEARLAPPVFERIDTHTLRFELGTATFVPLPGSRKTTIPGLMSVTLPAGIKTGEVYTLPVQQYAGRTLRFLGAFQLSIPIDEKANLLPGEIRKLALLRYVAAAMPEKDRWFAIFKRYLGEIEDRVRGFGGDPDDVEPSPYGGRVPGERDGQDFIRYEGKVSSLLYDCYGDFEGFVLDLCPGERRFHSREEAVERIVDNACRLRRRITVTVPKAAADGERPYRIELHC